MVTVAEPIKAEPSRAEPSKAEPSKAEPIKVEPSREEATVIRVAVIPMADCGHHHCIGVVQVAYMFMSYGSRNRKRTY